MNIHAEISCYFTFITQSECLLKFFLQDHLLDVACALHQDTKSHMGVIIYMGDMLVYMFVELILMRKVKVPIVYQDCNAVVTLVMKGGGQTRTKHLRAQFLQAGRIWYNMFSNSSQLTKCQSSVGQSKCC
jgi:hypothetical protein